MIRPKNDTIQTPTTYGQKNCLACSLTVAEYVNGELYTLFPGCHVYFHYQCWPIRGRHPPDPMGLIRTINPIQNYWR